MKKFAKISAVLAAMVLALAIFAACSEDDDDDEPAPSRNVVTKWTGDSATAFFYDNKEFEVVSNSGGRAASNVIMAGTYTGDTTAASAEITLNLTSGQDKGKTITAQISGGEISIPISGAAVKFTKSAASSSSKKLVSQWVLTESDDPESDIGEEFILLYDDGTFDYSWSSIDVVTFKGTYEKTDAKMKLHFTWVSKDVLGEAYDDYCKRLLNQTYTGNITGNKFKIWDDTFTLKQ